MLRSHAKFLKQYWMSDNIRDQITRYQRKVDDLRFNMIVSPISSLDGFRVAIAFQLQNGLNTRLQVSKITVQTKLECLDACHTDDDSNVSDVCLTLSSA
jgi:hypothetical protein